MFRLTAACLALFWTWDAACMDIFGHRGASFDAPENTLASITGALQRVPLLSDVIEVLPAGKRLIVEIKCGVEILPPLGKILEESGKLSRRAMPCFFWPQQLD